MGGRLLAVSVDPPQRSADVVTRQNLPFSILSDADRSVIAAYGVVHKGGGPDGGDIAIPSMFLIETGGRIAWQHVSTRVQERVLPATIIERARAISRP